MASALGPLEALRWGSPTRRESVSPTFAADATVRKILNNNPNRVSWVLVNKGAVDAHVDVTPQVSASQGFTLAANGGFLSFLYEEDGEAAFEEVYVVAPGGATTIFRQGVEVRQARKVPP